MSGENILTLLQAPPDVPEAHPHEVQVRDINLTGFTSSWSNVLLMAHRILSAFVLHVFAKFSACMFLIYQSRVQVLTNMHFSIMS